MQPKSDCDTFIRLLEQAIPDRHRDKAEILHLARQLVGANDYVTEMSDPAVLRAIHLYRKSRLQQDQEPIRLPALIHFLRTRRGLQQVDALERRLAKIREILFSLGAVDMLHPVQVNPGDILAMRVLAGIAPPWDADLHDAKEPNEEAGLMSEADIDDPPDTAKQR